MSPGIVRHIVAGILFVGVGTANAQELNPKPAVVDPQATAPRTGVPLPGVPFRLNCVAGLQGDVGVAVPISLMQVGDSSDTLDGGRKSATSRQDAIDAPKAKAHTGRRWFAGAVTRMAELVVRGVVEASK